MTSPLDSSKLHPGRSDTSVRVSTFNIYNASQQSKHGGTLQDSIRQGLLLTGALLSVDFHQPDSSSSPADKRLRAASPHSDPGDEADQPHRLR